MPAGVPLKVLLDGTERRSPLILTNSYGRPWIPLMAFGILVKGLRPCRRHRLDVSPSERVAVVRLALAEAAVP
jgi:hypothetical protein